MTPEVAAVRVVTRSARSYSGPSPGDSIAMREAV